MSHSAPTRRRLRALALGVALGLGGVPFTGATAQTTPPGSEQQQYDIPPGPLNTVLTRFAERSGTFIAGDLRLTADKHSAGLRGRFSREEALDRILAGSGLMAERQDDGSYTLKAASTSTPPTPVASVAGEEAVGSACF